MNRRELLTTAGATAAAAVVVGSGARAQEQRRSHSPVMAQRNRMHQHCLDECIHCETICNETAQHCMAQVAAGKLEHLRPAESALACQDFCGLSAKLIARSCPMMTAACEACAKACDACAAECEKNTSDEQMQACAKACRDCAASCREMA